MTYIMQEAKGENSYKAGHKGCTFPALNFNETCTSVEQAQLGGERKLCFRLNQQ